METIYTICYVTADVDFNELGHGNVIESHRDLEKAKSRLLEIVKENYQDTIAEEGESFITDNMSPDNTEFVIDEADYIQRFFIEENNLSD